MLEALTLIFITIILKDSEVIMFKMSSIYFDHIITSIY